MMGKHLVLFFDSADLFLSLHQHLALAALDQGMRVTILCPYSPAVEKVRAAGFSCQTLRLSANGLSPGRALIEMAGLWSALRRLQPDILHSFSFKPVLYGSLLGSRLGVPSIVNTVTGVGPLFHGDDVKTRFLRGALAALYKAAKRSDRFCFVFHNQDDQELYIRRGWVRREIARVIPVVGVDTQRFAPPKVEPDLPVRILFTGPCTKTAGLIELLQACDRLRAEELSFRLVISGKFDPSCENSIDPEKWSELEGRAFVELIGERHDPHAVYPSVHIVCLPFYGEESSRPLMEAAACGRPLVTTDVSGCRDVVRSGENGFLAEARSVSDLHRALRTLILDESMRIRFGRRSRELALTRFEQAVVVGEGLRVYGQAASAA